MNPIRYTTGPSVHVTNHQTSKHQFDIRTETVAEITESKRFFVDQAEVSEEEFMRIAREDGEFFGVTRPA
jgi:hypothetical protein